MLSISMSAFMTERGVRMAAPSKEQFYQDLKESEERKVNEKKERGIWRGISRRG